MTVTRRDATKLLGLGVIAASCPLSAFAQTPPVRLPLPEFVADARLLAALRRGVAAMKARKPSDPLSWFYQAAIHGVTDQLFCQAAASDPLVHRVNRAKYWNQCPHKGENSANFLPWHRGYTWHFEQILRMHSGEADFALPYWDYEIAGQREFPKAFGIEHLDGNVANNDPSNINPLFHAERDYFLCGYEHPFTDQLPLTELSSRAVSTARVMASPVFFGDTESEGVGGGILDNDFSTRGLLEQSPHDHVHRAVGGNVQGTDGNGNPVFATGGMAKPPTAGFDPIFPVHHANMDRLWARWACKPGKTWGKLPPAAWFDERPWYFFDTGGNEVNRPRRDYFDHRALGVRFRDDDPGCAPLALPAVIPGGAVGGLVRRPASLSLVQSVASDAPISASGTAATRVPIMGGDAAGRAESLRGVAQLMRAFAPTDEALILSLREVQIDRTGSTGFDVYLARAGTAASSLRPEDPRYLGPVSLFNHRLDGSTAIDQRFELWAAMQAIGTSSLAGLEVILVPYALTSAPRVATAPMRLEARRLDASGFAITRAPRTATTSVAVPNHH